MHETWDVFSLTVIFWLLWQPENRHSGVKNSKISTKIQLLPISTILTYYILGDVGCKKPGIFFKPKIVIFFTPRKTFSKFNQNPVFVSLAHMLHEMVANFFILNSFSCYNNQNMSVFESQKHKTRQNTLLPILGQDTKWVFVKPHSMPPISPALICLTIT